MRHSSAPPVLFFITSRKHIANTDIIRKFLHERDVQIVTDVQALSNESIHYLDSYEKIAQLAPQTIVMFMAYPYRKRLWLIEYSLKEGIPCVGVEEGHQLSLNMGRVNHYFAPLDGLAAPSEEEKVRLERIPVKYKENIEVTGWGFFDQIAEPTLAKSKNALIFLSPLQDIDIVSLETEAVRRNLLGIGRELIQRGYSVDIKPHPLEPKHHLKETLRAMGLINVSIVYSSNVGELLQGYDLVVNRGNSEVCIEAVHFLKKVLICPFGVQTIFDDCCNVLRSPSSLDGVLKIINSQTYVEEMEALRQKHLPYVGDEAVERVVEFIKNSENYTLSRDLKAFHLSLLYFLGGNKEKSLDLCKYLEPLSQKTLKRFLKRPWSPDNFVKSIKMTVNDSLAESYLSKIYLSQLSRMPFLKRLFRCDKDYIQLPDRRFVPFFWGEIFQHYSDVYQLGDHKVEESCHFD